MKCQVELDDGSCKLRVPVCFLNDTSSESFAGLDVETPYGPTLGSPPPAPVRCRITSAPKAVSTGVIPSKRTRPPSVVTTGSPGRPPLAGTPPLRQPSPDLGAKCGTIRLSMMPVGKQEEVPKRLGPSVQQYMVFAVTTPSSCPYPNNSGYIQMSSAFRNRANCALFPS